MNEDIMIIYGKKKFRNRLQGDIVYNTVSKDKINTNYLTEIICLEETFNKANKWFKANASKEKVSGIVIPLVSNFNNYVNSEIHFNNKGFKIFNYGNYMIAYLSGFSNIDFFDNILVYKLEKKINGDKNAIIYTDNENEFIMVVGKRFDNVKDYILSSENELSRDELLFNLNFKYLTMGYADNALDLKTFMEEDAGFDIIVYPISVVHGDEVQIALTEDDDIMLYSDATCVLITISSIDTVEYLSQIVSNIITRMSNELVSFVAKDGNNDLSFGKVKYNLIVNKENNKYSGELKINRWDRGIN